MMMTYSICKRAALGLALAASMSSCVLSTASMREPAARVNWERNNFELSAQVSAEATSTRIFGIDFERIFKKTGAEVKGGGDAGVAGLISSLPIIGSVLGDKVSGYALYSLMQANKGYDVIFYPQYELRKEYPILIPIYTKRYAKVTARLGKIK